MASANELKFQRANTKAFIAANSVVVTLIPRVTQTDGAGTRYTDGAPRAPQTFRIVPGTNSSSAAPSPGVVLTQDGRDRMAEFMMLGEHTVTWAVGDHWTDADGHLWEILQLFPENGYERRAGVLRHA